MSIPTLIQLPFQADLSKWSATALEFAAGAPKTTANQSQHESCVLLLVPSPDYLKAHDPKVSGSVVLMLSLVGRTKIEKEIELVTAIEIARYHGVVASAFIRDAGLNHTVVGIERGVPREVETYIRTLPDGLWERTADVEPVGFLPRFAPK